MTDDEFIENGIRRLYNDVLFLPGFFRDSAKSFMDAGAFDFALDAIADAYVSNNVKLSSELYTIFERVAALLDLHNDPVYPGVDLLLRQQAA